MNAVSSKVKSVSVRLATDEDRQTLTRYTNSSLIAMNTCPTWAIVKDQMQLGYASTSRAMALEAGAAMHEVFAAVRLWQLWKYDIPRLAPGTDHTILTNYHGKRLFGEDRWLDMLGQVPDGAAVEDERTVCLNFCLQALYSSGFYDDPNDNRRTMSNLEEAAIMYIDRWDFNKYPIWIRDINDPESDVGIEIKFDVVIEYTFEEQLPDHILSDGPPPRKSYLYSGTLDGLQIRNDELIIGENKTASRLDEAWRQSFEMSSQITGYALAATVFAQQPVSRGVVWGVQIPLPKSYEYGGLVVEHVTRESFKTERWFDWFLYTVQQYERYHNDPHGAPKFTHSCNRYFRPCSMIPFCASDDEEQKLALSEMVVLEDRYADAKGAD